MGAGGGGGGTLLLDRAPLGYGKRKHPASTRHCENAALSTAFLEGARTLLDQSASTLRAPGTVFFLRPFRALLSLARRGVGRPRVMLVMQAEDQNPRHVPGVSCFRTCRECRRLASMPVPSPRGRQVQAQLAVALEKGLSLGGERPSPVASPDSSSPTGIWNGIANLSFGDSSQALVCQVADQEPQSRSGGGRRPAAVADAMTRVGQWMCRQPSRCRPAAMSACARRVQRRSPRRRPLRGRRRSRLNLSSSR